jgi:hypothetical protein
MKKLLVVLIVSAVSLFSVSAMAYQVKVDDDTYANFLVMLQARVQSLEDAAPNGTDSSFDVNFFNVRLAVAGQITDLTKFGLNFDPVAKTTFTAGAASQFADAWITFDLAKEAKVQTGIYRMAVSRLALQNSYTYVLPDFPLVGGPKFLTDGLAGFRDAGITAWGDLADGMVKYYAAIWDAQYIPDAAGGPLDPDDPVVVDSFDVPNRKDTTGKSLRLVYNILEPEKGYGTLGTYLGKARIANVGVAYFMQDYTVGSATGPEKTYSVLTADAFYDVAGLTVEGAYFTYDNDKGVVGSKPSGWYLQAAYMIEKLQPALRYESWDADAATGDYSRIVAGVNYYLDGQNAKVQLEYLMHNTDDEGAAIDRANPGSSRDYADIILQLQTQF